MLLAMLLILSETDYVPHQTQVMMLLKSNEIRVDQGKKPHKLNPALSKAAQRQAEWLAKTKRFSHRIYNDPPPAGSTPAKRSKTAGYKGAYRNEVIAWSSKEDIDHIFGIWRKQLTNGKLAHWAAINGNHTDAGYGYANVNGTIMAVGIFGKPFSKVRQAVSSNRQSGYVSRGRTGPLRRLAQFLSPRRRR